jgi:hypothetical protein
MQHVHVAVYKIKPGMVDEVARRAETGMLPTFRSQPGFVAYGIARDDYAVNQNTFLSTAQRNHLSAVGNASMGT